MVIVGTNFLLNLCDEIKIMGTSRFNLNTEYIELVKLIKLYSKGLSGGEVKTIIEQGEVLRNGSVEYRKRAKLVKGDAISFFDTTIEIT